MRFSLFLTIMLISSYALADKFPKRVYLDAEDGRKASVFNLPGVLSWDMCARRSGCESVSWPDNTSDIQILKPIKKMKVKSLYGDGQYTDEEFAFVEVSYPTASGEIKTRRGWIDAARLSDKKVKPFFTEKQPANKKAACDPKDKPAPKVSPDLKPIATALENNGITGTAEALKPYVGQCVLKSVRNPNASVDNTYDNYVLPTLLNAPLPRIQGEGGKKITRQQLIDIDALARTLYGEMAGCFKHGLQYPMAVARIAYNRSQTPERASEFIKGVHNTEKSAFAKVVTSASQFNVWMPTHGAKNNGSLKMALCPPSGKETYWKGVPPGDSEREIWDDALRIATEAVLFPTEKFQKRTINIVDYHYTSGMDKFYNFKKVFPSIEGRSVSRNSCVQVWRYPKKA